MPTYIQNLLNNALGDGARATKFDCDIFFTNNSLFPDTDSMRTLVKTTSFPGKSHEVVDLKFKGRSIPLKGQGKYGQTWSCTFYLPEDHRLKNAFEIWLEALDQVHNYTPNTSRTPGLVETQNLHASGYTSNIMLFQRNFNGDQITAQYNLHNVFPTEISNVEYSAESVGQVQEFTVTFAYSYYEMQVIKGKHGNFIDEFIGSAIGNAQDIFNGGLESLNKMAGDAIGGSVPELQSLMDFDINNLVGRGTETNNGVSEQIAKGPKSMTKTFQGAVSNK